MSSNIITNSDYAINLNSGANTLSLTGVFSATGNITGNFFIGNGSQLTGIAASYGNANVVANLAALGSNPVSTTGNITGGNILGGANVNATTYTGTTVSVTGNVTGGNITTAGLVVTTGNVSGGNIIAATLVQSATVSASGNITGGNLTTTGTANVASLAVTGSATVQGSISIFTTSTSLSAAGNIIGSNFIVSGVLVSTNTVSAIGNITGNYFIGNGSQLTGVVSSYGNANVVANLAALGSNPVSTTGNITGGNILGGANVNATTHTGTTVSVTANVTGGNILTAGLISATGNITGNFFIGNGSQLTGIAASYGNSNVVANVAALGTNPVSTTGNITGGNVLGGANVNATTHTGTTVSVSANVTGGNILFGSGIVSGTGNIFGGNLTIAGNTATITTASYSIGYLNVPQVSLAANATTALTDSGKHYYSTSASNLTLTVADNSAVSWPVGTSFIVVNRGTGNITVAPAAGVSLYLAGNSTSANRVLTTYNLATCLNLAANVWMISGSGLV